MVRMKYILEAVFKQLAQGSHFMLGDTHVHVTWWCQTGHVYSLLMRANMLETATVQGSLACLAPSRIDSCTCTCV